MSGSVTLYIQKFLIRTVIWLAIILMAITIVRATTVALAIRKAAEGQSYNERLVRNWSPAYPILHQILLTIEGPSERPRTHVQPSALENVLLFGPDLLMNMVLQQTHPLWYPDNFPDLLGQTPPSTIDPSVAAGPAPRTDVQDPAAGTDSSVSAPPPGDGTPATAPRTPSTDAPTPPVDQPEVQPQPAYDPNAMWAAITNPSTPIYNLAGEQQERIPAGSVMDIKERRRTTNGALFTGTVYSPIGKFDQVAVRAQDLQLYRGKTLHDTTLAEREHASEKARLLGAITARKEEIEAASANRNPHQAEYHQALRSYQALRQEAQGLQDKYKTSTGAERMSLGNRLREIKEAMATLTPTIQRLKEKRDTWNAANPQTAGVDPEKDPIIINLRRQLAAIEND